MSERRSLGSLAREPLYNTRAVVQATDVPADTIRVWERRYRLPRPFRTPTNQRLYSERDIGIISWLRQRTDEGMTISQAIQRMRLEFPGIFAVERPAVAQQPAQLDSASLVSRQRQRLLDACVVFDSLSADLAIDEGLARFSIDAFCALLVEPLLDDLRDCATDDDLSVAVRHFTTQVLVRRLAALLTIVRPARWRGTVLTASTPTGDHEVELLVLAILLSRHGWRAVTLGPNVPLDVIVSATRQIRPDLVCISTTVGHVANQARGIAMSFATERDPPPVVLAARETPPDALPQSSSRVRVVVGSALEVVDVIAELIERPGTIR